MATSSIFTNVRITDPKKAEAFIKAFEESEALVRDKKNEMPSNVRIVTDPEEVRKIFAKRLKK
mgnify:FL=1